MPGENRSTTSPVRSTRNLVKFHLIAWMPSSLGLGRLQRPPKRMRPRAVHLHLGEHREANTIVHGTELVDRGFVARLLPAKLVAR